MNAAGAMGQGRETQAGGWRRGAALVEQGAVAGANFVAFVLFARALEPAAWGEFGFAYALLLFLQGFQRALVTIPMVTFSARTGGGGWEAGRRAWVRGNASLALLSALALVGAAAAVRAGGPEWLWRALLMATLMALPLFAHEFARRAAVQEQRLDVLAASGLAYAFGLLSVAVLPLAAWWPGSGSWQPALAVTVGAGAAALVCRLGTGRGAFARPGGVPPLAGWGAYAGWSSAAHLAYSGYNFGVQALLAALAGPAAVGLFHACRTLVQPVSVLIGALDALDKPRAAAALAAGGPTPMRRVLARSALTMALPALPFLAAVAVFAEPLLALLYGQAYRDAATAVSAACLFALCAMAAQPVESGLYVVHRPGRLFAGRSVAALAGLAVAALLVPAHGATGAYLAMAAGYALTAAAGVWTLAREAPMRAGAPDA
jgi:O-antigen/teichoic acid export membrane protein